MAKAKKFTVAELKQAAKQLGARGGKATARKNKKLAKPIKGGFWNRKKKSKSKKKK